MTQRPKGILLPAELHLEISNCLPWYWASQLACFGYVMGYNTGIYPFVQKRILSAMDMQAMRTKQIMERRVLWGWLKRDAPWTTEDELNKILVDYAEFIADLNKLIIDWNYFAGTATNIALLEICYWNWIERFHWEKYPKGPSDNYRVDLNELAEMGRKQKENEPIEAIDEAGYNGDEEALDDDGTYNSSRWFKNWSPSGGWQF